jgi:hypothetical protein
MFSDGYLRVENSFFLRDESHQKPLSLQVRCPSALVVFRMLLGGVFISTPTSVTIQQPNNFFVPGYPISRGFTFNDEIGRAFPGLGEQDRNGNFLSYTVVRSLNKFFYETGTNRGFFDVLTNELARSFIASGSGNDLAAFVYLYRAIEHISYALPLFHARHAKNYVKAFNDLRALISTGDGELKFCEKFIRNMFHTDSQLAEHKYEFSFPGPYHIAYEKYLKTNHSKHCSCISGGIEVQFLHAFGFIVDVRNKFFHHLSGSNQSASSKEIVDAEAFFRPINQVGRSLVALVFGRMIAAEL